MMLGRPPVRTAAPQWLVPDAEIFVMLSPSQLPGYDVIDKVAIWPHCSHASDIHVIICRNPPTSGYISSTGEAVY